MARQKSFPEATASDEQIPSAAEHPARFRPSVPDALVMRKYLVEFIGTFFLVFTVGNTVIEPGAGPLAPIAIGSILMVMIFAGGHISGGHYNPAVTLAVWLRGKCPTSDVAGYMIAQFAAGLVAAFLVLFMKGDSKVTAMAFERGDDVVGNYGVTVGRNTPPRRDGDQHQRHDVPKSPLTGDNPPSAGASESPRHDERPVQRSAGRLRIARAP